MMWTADSPVKLNLAKQRMPVLGTVPCGQPQNRPHALLEQIKDVQLTVIEGGPHAIPWTHAGQVNTALLDFMRS